MQRLFELLKNNISDRSLYRNALSSRWFLPGFFLFLLVSIVLRLYRLDGSGLWGDELFTFQLTSSGTLADMLEKISWEKTNPRLHYIAIWAWFKTFGMSVWIGRVLSVLAGVLGVVTMYFLGRRMFNRETGLYAMALCALCYHHLAISQDARPYAMIFLFSALSFLFFIAVLRGAAGGLQWRNLAGYVIFSALMVHTHHTGLWVLVAEGLLFVLHSVLNRHQVDRKFFLFAGVAAFSLLLAFLPLYSILSGAVALEDHFTTILNSSFVYIFASYVHFFGSSFPLVIVISLAIVFGVLVVALSPLPQARHGFMVVCLLVWVAVVCGISYLYSRMAVPIMHYRYFTVALPPLLLLAAWGLSSAGVKYALLALLIQTSSIAENMVFTKRHGAFSPETQHSAYQISYPRDRMHRKQALEELTSYDEPAFIVDVPNGDLSFYEKIYDFPGGSMGGREDFMRHLQGKPKTFWIIKMWGSKWARRDLDHVESQRGILQKGYQRGPELNYKRIVARRYLPVYEDLTCCQ